MAPAAKSGMPIRSSLGRVKGMPNKDSKAGSTIEVMFRAVSRFSALQQPAVSMQEYIGND